MAPTGRRPSWQFPLTQPRANSCAWRNKALLGSGRRARRTALQLRQCLLGLTRKRPVRHDFQVSLVVLHGILRTIELFETLRRPEVCYRVIRLVEQRFLIPAERGLIVFLSEVKIADFDVLHGLVRIEWMEFLHRRVVHARFLFRLAHRCRAVRMVFRVVRRRAEVNLRVLARAHASLGVAFRRSVLRRYLTARVLIAEIFPMGFLLSESLIVRGLSA